MAYGVTSDRAAPSAPRRVSLQETDIKPKTVCHLPLPQSARAAELSARFASTQAVTFFYNEARRRPLPPQRRPRGRCGTLFMERMQMVVRIGDCTWSATGREGSADSKERQGPIWGKVYILVDIQGGPIDEHTHSLG